MNTIPTNDSAEQALEEIASVASQRYINDSDDDRLMAACGTLQRALAGNPAFPLPAKPAGEQKEHAGLIAVAEGLKSRVDKFNALELPGQPMMMHMGTSYLVGDLWNVTRELCAALREADGRKDSLAWRPIAGAPKDGTRFLAGDADGMVAVVSRHDPGGHARNPRLHYECWVTDLNVPTNGPLYWMPLPDSPKGEGP